MSSSNSSSSSEHTPKRRSSGKESASKRAKPAAPKKRKPAHYGSVNNNEIETPDNLLRAIRDEFGDFFDPCPFVGKGNKPDFDGTTIEWGPVNYVNPPYNDIEPWCIKAVDEGRKGKTSILLVPVRTGTRYWQHYVYPYADELRFITGKIIFKGYDNPSPHHLVLIVYRPNYRITQSPPPLQELDYGDVFDAQKMLDDKYAQRRFPELSMICSSQHKAVSGQHSDPDTVAYKKKWFDLQLSFKELVLPTDSDESLDDILYQVCLPLFYQICLYEREQHVDETSLPTLLSSLGHDDLDTPYPLPTLLRRFKPLLMCTKTLRKRLFKQNSVLPSHRNGLSFHVGVEVMTATWYKDAVGFYSAYVENSRLTRARLTRSVYSIKSDDGEFEQIVISL